MAKSRISTCKLCRREGIKLFLKGDRCDKEKCAVSKRSYPPGQHGQHLSKLSEYGTRLREKQRAKKIYGVLESQFRRYFKIAEKQQGATGENLLQILETRLDNVMFKLGLAPSKSTARQLISHGHIRVNGKKVDVPSFIVKPGSVISLIDKSKNLLSVKSSIERAVTRKTVPVWLELNPENATGVVKNFPTKEEIASPLQERLIVEFYSR